jgi:hypothetical protein
VEPGRRAFHRRLFLLLIEGGGRGAGRSQFSKRRAQRAREEAERAKGPRERRAGVWGGAPRENGGGLLP